MLIDAHAHYTPPSMADDLEGFAEREPYWGMLITPDPVNHTAQGWATPEQMLADMDRSGIDKLVLLGVYRQKHESCVETNNDALGIMRRWPDRVIPFAVVQPKAGDQALDELKRCLDAGMRGLGEISPYGSGYTLEDPEFLRLAEACIEFDIPMNLHVSEEIGHFYLGKSTTPLLHYYRLACRYPELKLILAHWGGGLFFYEIMPEVRRNLANVWYDVSSTPLMYETSRIFPVALQCIDHRKILYGSSYPLLLYPREAPLPEFDRFIAAIGRLGLSPDVQADIMGNNAAQLLGLAAPRHPAGTRAASRAQSPASAIITERPDQPGVAISRAMAVRMVAAAWPATQAVFDQYGIPWQDMPVPFWEPIAQAAAARGWGPKAQQQLLEDLNAAIA